MAQPAEYGGLGLGTTVTSFVFLGCIAALIVYMTVAQYRSERPARLNKIASA